MSADRLYQLRCVAATLDDADDTTLGAIVRDCANELAAKRALAADLAAALDAMLMEAPTGVTTATATRGREAMARYRETRQR